MSFQTLAFEIQLQIWEQLISEPRIIKLSHCSRKESKLIATPSDIPIVLHICRSSRHFGLNHYQKYSLGGYCNFATDILLLSQNVFPFIGWYNRPFSPHLPLLASEIVSLQHIGLFFPTVLGFVHNKKERALRFQVITQHLKKLTTITYFWDNPFISTIDMGMQLGEQASDFDQLDWKPQSKPELMFQFLPESNSVL